MRNANAPPRKGAVAGGPKYVPEKLQIDGDQYCGSIFAVNFLAQAVREKKIVA